MPADRPERGDAERWLEVAEDLDPDAWNVPDLDLPEGSHRSHGETAAGVSIRAAARSCDMEGAIAIAGLDEIVDELDRGMPFLALNDGLCRRCQQLIASMLPYLTAVSRAAMTRLHQDLAR